MPDEKQRFRVVAESPKKPGDLIVEDEAGKPRLFLGSAGAVSRKNLNPDFLHVLLDHEQWRRVEDDRWYALDDLCAAFHENP